MTKKSEAVCNEKPRQQQRVSGVGLARYGNVCNGFWGIITKTPITMEQATELAHYNRAIFKVFQWKERDR